MLREQNPKQEKFTSKIVQQYMGTHTTYPNGEWSSVDPHHQNFPKTLPRPPYSDAELPNNMPTPSCSATLTGRIGALSQTCGQGSGNGGLDNRGLARSRSYIDSCRGAFDSSSH